MSSDSRAFWEGCQEGRLLVQQCLACGHRQLYPRLYCTECHGDRLDWAQVAGTGTVWSFTVIRKGAVPDFKARMPYVIALIDLDDGPRIMSNVVEVDPGEVRIGMRVEVEFRPDQSGLTLPVFHPAGAGGGEGR